MGTLIFEITTFIIIKTNPLMCYSIALFKCFQNADPAFFDGTVLKCVQIIIIEKDAVSL